MCVRLAERQMRERQRERVSHTHTQEPVKGQRLVLTAQDRKYHTHTHTHTCITHTCVLLMHRRILKSRKGKHSSILGLNYISRLPKVFGHFERRPQVSAHTSANLLIRGMKLVLYTSVFFSFRVKTLR